MDYKDTVFLPKTDFPLRGGLPQKEPVLLAEWQQKNVYAALREARADQPSFMLHDGPPYANGNIHIGHATNKILKDVVNRYASIEGHSIHYVPGWDCHGLPIEWKIEEKYRAAGKNKDDVPILQFRQECREFAAEWIGVQAAEFARLGILGDWSGAPESFYSTMTTAAEARIVSEIHKFLLNGLLYQGARPVMWSTVEKTALADAEVEYHDHKSTSIWVGFPVQTAPDAKYIGARVVIWTTTPWTIPGNRAIAFGDFDYAMIRVDSVTENAKTKPADQLIVAADLLPQFTDAAGITDYTVVETITADDLASFACRHPLYAADPYYGFAVPLLRGEFVTTDAGTGFVHIAPGHGEDDFHLGKANNIAVPPTVDDAGAYYESVGLFAGKKVFTAEGKEGDANGAVMKALAEASALLAKKNITHSYPHSWRSKAPLIFRTTPQWFIAMDKKITDKTLRETALAAIADTTWVPAQGENRIRAMVEQRPDWCISRQRAWGVPIAIFVNKKTHEPLRDAAVCQRIVDIFAAEGSDAWYALPASDFLGADYNADDYTQIFDIVDVWFEAGSTHAFVLEDFKVLSSPADLYLEGSDQHRGWFQSSLLESCGTRGHAPFKTVLTHGFVLDENGRKMSKSMGNVTAPQKIIDQYGADILRLWVINTNYEDDVRIGADILKQQADLYRRLRNTLRYVLGALDGYKKEEAVAYDEMPELERYVLARLAAVDAEIKMAIAAYDFGRVFKLVYALCDSDLSAFYFDIRKDSLYCDAPSAVKRRAARTVMQIVFDCLAIWLAPVLVFTAEEAWQARYGADAQSIHLQTAPTIAAEWHNDALVTKWDVVRTARGMVTAQLEKLRGDKVIGSSLEASITQTVTTENEKAILDALDYADICIVSAAAVIVGTTPTVDARKIETEKCERCWRYVPDVGRVVAHPTLCARCADAVAQTTGQAA